MRALPFVRAAFFGCLFTCAVVAAEVAPGESSPAPPKGLRVLTAGHSFHAWLPGFLSEVAGGAQVQGHQQVAVSAIGGSHVIQHWDAEGARQKIKPVLTAGQADVLTLSPIYLPDEGIEKFVKLGLEHNPDLRVTVQEFWLPFDDQALWAKHQAREKIVVDRDSKSIGELREKHAAYFESMDQHVRELNARHGESAVLVVPVGQAVLALRERVIKGEAPGIARQSDLFTDPLGHPREHIKVLAAYCHYAVIYGRSPVGLPVPASLHKVPESDKLNPLLQELAWQAVSGHSLSGVKSTGAR